MTRAKHELPWAILMAVHRCPALAKSTGEQCRQRVQPGYTTCPIHGSANHRSHAAAAGRLMAEGLMGRTYSEGLPHPYVPFGCCSLTRPLR